MNMHNKYHTLTYLIECFVWELFVPSVFLQCHQLLKTPKKKKESGDEYQSLNLLLLFKSAIQPSLSAASNEQMSSQSDVLQVLPTTWTGLGLASIFQQRKRQPLSFLPDLFTAISAG